MKRLTTAGLSIFLGLSVALPVFAFEDGDLQLWNTNSIKTKLNKSLKIKVEEELRFGDNISELYYTHTDGGLTYGVNDNLDLGINYRQVFVKIKGEWKEEYRPHANATLKWVGQDLKFSDRSRLEFRMPEGEDDRWRYRNKLSVKFPWKWTDLDIQPYVADEVFIDFDGEKLNRNRLYAGFQMKLIEHLKADIFYLWQASEKSDKWTSYNVIGIKLKAFF